ncbi:ribosomal RNA small subunit methyltransferase E [Clostridium homopropionicum DSM 5847]|uniref:Ribosomal RNA small subunit methyltransferase E n=1 Tax=Clostridium homopropionicum DSM 5847 TaxID=1121318 RepID=A0A0L6ZE40_9CLOT|nr:16S rRNA (uracil(1498)-N(3))-methyltransferase [Clostridium homopropionicum]KOA21241.1 ribosomal RNA small subunit methyltransferase E [Clostridium homopropionicum DSM 5847]SFG28375.1 16S rRNA (uracil1498-N3)-methyltransferase [Clostridium homopropionicum]
MHKFFVSQDNIDDDIAVIEGEDVKHIYKVLRLKEGEKVNINNCQGEEFIGEIIDINKNSVQVKLIDKLEINNESPIEVYLYQGFPKGPKMDLISQKCTELGVKEITPVITKRVLSSLGEINKDTKKLDRWNKIAFEACKQSKRTIVPVINDVIDFKELINQLKYMDLVVVPYENAEGYGIKQMVNSIIKEVKRVAIVIGPEGGFEEEEIASLKATGANIITLGPRILRTETAGFICLGLIMYELGDLGGKL